ncbi:MAG: hypothetical protein PHT89_04605 [Lachnospiraceae bacterium]|nr:hypothetical protein [Lachnospiraceae bacterium]MDD3659986.1 hypothetical protein [Lachnospiraceae bacterium]
MQFMKEAVKKYCVFLLIAVFLFLIMPGKVNAASNTLVNGGFEYPNLNVTTGQWWTNYNPTMEQQSSFGWNTTSNSTPKFEFGGDWNVNAWGIQFIPEGRQFIELNANVQAAAYQDLNTTPGTIIYWSLYQGGVWYWDSTNIDNTMAVRIGTQGQLPVDTMKTSSGTAYDQEWTKRTIYKLDSKSEESDTPPAYDGKDADKKRLFTQMKRWTRYEGLYVVPEGQTITRFAFASLSGIPTQGNLLDGIEFRVATQDDLNNLGNTSGSEQDSEAQKEAARIEKAKRDWEVSDSNPKNYLTTITGDDGAIITSGVPTKNQSEDYFNLIVKNETQEAERLFAKTAAENQIVVTFSKASYGDELKKLLENKAALQNGILSKVIQVTAQERTKKDYKLVRDIEMTEEPIRYNAQLSDELLAAAKAGKKILVIGYNYNGETEVLQDLDNTTGIFAFETKNPTGIFAFVIAQ